MRGRKTAAVCAAIVAAVLLWRLLSAEEIVKKPGDGTPEGGLTRISFFANVDNVSLTDDAVVRFNESSRTTLVNVSYVLDERYDEEIAKHLASGNSPDCVYLRRSSQANRLAVSGLLTDLTPYITLSDLDLANFGSAMDTTYLDTGIFVLPQTRNTYMLFYNKEIFRVGGLPYPENITWEEYAELAATLTSGRGSGRVWGGFIPTSIPFNLGACFSNEYLTDDELNNTWGYLETLNRLYNTDGSHPDVNGADYYGRTAYAMFAEGKIAMMINGDWAIQEIQSNIEAKHTALDWNVARLPRPDGTEPGTAVGNSSYLAVSASCVNPANAFEFISFFCGEEGSEIIAEYTACPAYFTASSAEIYLRTTKVSGAGLFFNSFIIGEEAPYPLYGSLSAIFREQALSYLTGKQTLDETISAYEEQRMAFLGG